MALRKLSAHPQHWAQEASWPSQDCICCYKGHSSSTTYCESHSSFLTSVKLNLPNYKTGNYSAYFKVFL